MKRSKKFATLKDVARACDLSVATVSRYLNRSIRLPPETIHRIEAAIELLNYQPNPHARRLSLGRSETIGLVVPDIANPFFARLASAVEQTAAEHGIGVVLCATLNRRERELDYLRRLSHNQVDGLLFVTNQPDNAELAAAVSAAQTVVLLDEDIIGSASYKLFADNVAGAQIGTRHLVEHGHRRIAYVGAQAALMSGSERLLGYRKALAEIGRSPDPTLEFFGDYDMEHGIRAAEAILAQSERPTAIFCASDGVLLGVLKVLHQRGMRGGTDMSLVAFDDMGPLDLLEPAITAVRQSVETMGRRGVEILLGCINGTLATPTTERVPVELIPRASVRRIFTPAS